MRSLIASSRSAFSFSLLSSISDSSYNLGFLVNPDDLSDELDALDRVDLFVVRVRKEKEITALDEFGDAAHGKAAVDANQVKAFARVPSAADVHHGKSAFGESRNKVRANAPIAAQDMLFASCQNPLGDFNGLAPLEALEVSTAQYRDNDRFALAGVGFPNR